MKITEAGQDLRDAFALTMSEDSANGMAWGRAEDGAEYLAVLTGGQVGFWRKWPERSRRMILGQYLDAEPVGVRWNPIRDRDLDVDSGGDEELEYADNVHFYSVEGARCDLQYSVPSRMTALHWTLPTCSMTMS